MIDERFLSINKWQYLVRDYCICLANKFKTFRTQNYAVINRFITTLSCNYPLNWIPSTLTVLLFKNRNEILPAFCTSSIGISFRTSGALPLPSTVSNSPHELNRVSHSPPPLKFWRKGCSDDCWYDLNGKWTGIHIIKVTRYWVTMSKPIPPIKLSRPIFRISFIPNGNRQMIIEMAARTLIEAKKLAESYYEAWLNVNQDEKSR